MTKRQVLMTYLLSLFYGVGLLYSGDVALWCIANVALCGVIAAAGMAVPFVPGLAPLFAPMPFFALYAAWFSMWTLFGRARQASQGQRSVMGFWKIGGLAACALAFSWITGLVIEYAVFDLRQIPTESMFPAVRAGDTVFVSRWIYRFTSARKGDIVLFKGLESEPEMRGRAYLKRVVGLPGDHLRFDPKNGEFTINGHVVPDSLLATEVSWLRKLRYQELVVPEDSFFVLGDNRGFSCDSRFFGPIPKERVLGRYVAVVEKSKH